VRYRCNPNVDPTISSIVDSVIAAMAIAAHHQLDRRRAV
jgi:hypothetical protein